LRSSGAATRLDGDPGASGHVGGSMEAARATPGGRLTAKAPLMRVLIARRQRVVRRRSCHHHRGDPAWRSSVWRPTARRPSPLRRPPARRRPDGPAHASDGWRRGDGSPMRRCRGRAGRRTHDLRRRRLDHRGALGRSGRIPHEGCHPDDIRRALEAAAAGQSVLDPAVQHRFSKLPRESGPAGHTAGRLTDREAEVLA